MQIDKQRSDNVTMHVNYLQLSYDSELLVVVVVVSETAPYEVAADKKDAG